MNEIANLHNKSSIIQAMAMNIRNIFFFCELEKPLPSIKPPIEAPNVEHAVIVPTSVPENPIDDKYCDSKGQIAPKGT